jgi:hypothetical protein
MEVSNDDSPSGLQCENERNKHSWGLNRIVEERSWPGSILGLPGRPIPPANAIPSYAPAQAPSSNYDQTVTSDCWPHAR